MKIIEEQLAFPSGTATAQLVSVLHELPPPDTAGYDIGYNVSWLDPGEKQLTDLAKAADGVQVCLS